MRVLYEGLVDNGLYATIQHSTRLDGDLSPSTVAADQLRDLRAKASGHAQWIAPRQVHGARVLLASTNSATDATARPEADAVVTADPDIAIAVHTGDCVPIGLVSSAGAVAVVHAGWKGLEAGVIEAAVDALRSLHDNVAQTVTAVVGPHIHAANYEFGTDDLARLSDRFGEHVVATTAGRTPALDLTAAVTHELERVHATVATISPDCTAELADTYWSHRARKEAGRIALVAWLHQP